MTNLGTLYGFECKKIWKKKMVRAAVIIGALLIFFSIMATLLGSYYVDGEKADTHYHMFQVDKGYAKELDGRPIDQALLEEMKAGYGKIPSGAERYTLTEEYQRYARPYSAVLGFVRKATGMKIIGIEDIEAWQPDEQGMYAQRKLMLEKEWKNSRLTGKEVEFWERQEEALEWPVQFRYQEGYEHLLGCLYTVGFVVFVVITISLSGIFSEEHTRKTDQLIISSKYGRRTVYWAKFLAGASFSLLVSLFFTGITFFSVFFLYGAEGFGADFRLMWPWYSYPLGMGEAAFIAYGMLAASGVLMGIVVMLLSETFRSSLGTMAVVVGILFLPMFLNIPSQYRILSQVWSYVPSVFIDPINIFDWKTVSVFGKCFVPWQAVPVLYVMLGGAFAVIGKRVFMSYQVKGR